MVFYSVLQCSSGVLMVLCSVLMVFCSVLMVSCSFLIVFCSVLMVLCSVVMVFCSVVMVLCSGAWIVVCVGGHPVYRAFLRGLSTNMRSGIFKKMSATLNLRGKILQTETMCTLDATQPELCLNTITTNHIYQQHQ